MNRNLWLLALCQGLFLTNNVTFIAINGLVGLSLAPRGWMATLPVMGYVVGGALSTGLVARTQRRFGRRGSFQIGLAVALGVGAAVRLRRGRTRLLAAVRRDGGGRLLQRQRQPVPLCRGRTGGAGLAREGGVAGDGRRADRRGGRARTSRPSRATCSPCPSPAPTSRWPAVALLAMAMMHFIEFPPARRRSRPRGSGRSLAEIARQPVFIVAAASGALGFGVMNLLMAATPLAMQVCSLPFDDIALVLEWHVIGMFAPGFFTGHLIRRFGALPVMGVGLALNLGCIAVALSGVDLHRS